MCVFFCWLLLLFESTSFSLSSHLWNRMWETNAVKMLYWKHVFACFDCLPHTPKFAYVYTLNTTGYSCVYVWSCAVYAVHFIVSLDLNSNRLKWMWAYGGYHLWKSIQNTCSKWKGNNRPIVEILIITHNFNLDFISVDLKCKTPLHWFLFHANRHMIHTLNALNQFRNYATTKSSGFNANPANESAKTETQREIRIKSLNINKRCQLIANSGF